MLHLIAHFFVSTVSILFMKNGPKNGQNDPVRLLPVNSRNKSKQNGSFYKRP